MTRQSKGDILIVDDYENWRDFWRCILEDDGYEVTTAHDFLGAKLKLEAQKFDVVILDMRLIDQQKYNVEGMALLKIVKERSPLTGAVIITGYPDETHKRRALEVYGADAYLAKVPSDSNFDFDTDGFRKLIKNLAERSHTI